jgi:hypothetical protein
MAAPDAPPISAPLAVLSGLPSGDAHPASNPASAVIVNGLIIFDVFMCLILEL